MAQYECSVCGFVHDESKDGTWENLPDDWTCPVCGANKSQFEKVAGGAASEAVVGEPSELSELSEADVAPEAGVAEVAAAAPTSRAILAHRVFGYVFLAIYLLLIVQMIPRLWGYQIEFPARTVVHISLGMAVGIILLLKIGIVRFFRRLDQSLVPMLGTSLLVLSVVLIGISAPFAFQEALATRKLLGEENRERVRTLLQQTGLDLAACTRLTAPESLRKGQRILRQECIACHDLRTVLARPRTPSNWRQTVKRMADRTTMLNPLEETEQLQVTAYLVALSPDLRKSAQQLSEFEDRRAISKRAADTVLWDQTAAATYDPVSAQKLFDEKCSQCHETDLVQQQPPADEQQARELVARMVDEGLEATEEELVQIVRHLTQTYAKASE